MLIPQAARIVLVLLALAGFGALVFTMGPLRRDPPPAPGTPTALAPVPKPGEPQAEPTAPGGAPSEAARPSASAPPAPAQPPANPSAAIRAAEPVAPQQVTPAPAVGAPDSRSDQAADAPPSPAFDVVRVEPSGESVIAGRAAPGATVELLRDGKPHDRVVSDPSGLFAMTPAPLAPGDHELTLRFTTPDGKRAISREAVAVSIAPGRNERPMVALTAPDRPTVVLSAPAPAGDKSSVQAAAPAAPGAQPAMPSAQPPQSSTPQQQSPPAAAKPPARPAVAVETVETEEGGKLYVSGRAAPGATIRLYLNNSYLASGSAAPEGRLSFTIGGGVGPGDYQVRLDEVDPVTGSVKSRAEVPFNVPPVVVAATPRLPSSELRPSLDEPVPSRIPPSAQAPAASPSAGSPASPLAQAPAGSRVPPSAQAPVGPPPPGSPASPSAQVPAASPASPPARVPAVVPPASPGQRQAAAPQAWPAGTLPSAVLVPEVRTAIVSRGDSLWRISRRTYGEGLRYTVIYVANQNQIGNPDLIYPGQTFVRPGERPQ